MPSALEYYIKDYKDFKESELKPFRVKNYRSLLKNKVKYICTILLNPFLSVNACHNYLYALRNVGNTFMYSPFMMIIVR